MGLFDFDAFALKDIWKGVKKDPERLLMGAVDPLSTKMWNGITGKDYEPLVDQMGGPYGGHTFSAFGDNEGGVYKRAEEAGIDTGKAKSMHDGAHVLAAFFGGQGLMGAGQNLMGAQAGGSNLGVFGNGGTQGMGSVGGGNAGSLANSGGIQGGAGMGTATPPSPMGWQDFMKMGQQMPMPQQQQQQEGPKPYWINGRIVWL